jgi:hypothetical protein
VKQWLKKCQKWVQGFGVIEILDGFSIGFFMCLIFVGCMWILVCLVNFSIFAVHDLGFHCLSI